jgi:transcriptional pleiotropic regulator of transition state genes
MRATGIVRKIDGLGRIVLPKEMRKVRGMEVDDPIKFFSEGEYIVIRKYLVNCIYCGQTADVEYYKGKPICKSCAMDFIKHHQKEEEGL